MRVRMREVAQHAKVSTQTVSAVLNGKSGISKATTARVRQSIAAMGYQPNLLASSLRSGRSTTVGLLLPNVANPYFAEVARGVQDAAQTRGYSVILCNHDNDPIKIHAYMQLLNQYRVAGVIGEPYEQDAAPYGADTDVQVVCESLPGVGTYRVDDRRGGYVATAHLLDLGHRRIGCITGPRPSKPGDDRLAGYLAALRDWSVAVDESLIVEGAFDYASGRSTRILLEQVPRPTAIFAHNDLMAIGVIVALKQAGLRVSEDVAVIGYDDAEIAGLYDPPLSTVAQPTYELGAWAMTVLAERLAGLPATQSTAAPLDCELIVRRSSVPGLDEDRRCGPIAVEASWRQWRVEAPVTSFT